MGKGSQPTDGARIKRPGGGYDTYSNLIMEKSERDRLVKAHPRIGKVIRPFVGSEELLSGKWSYCLWLKDASPSDYDFPEVKERLRRVREGRLQSPTASVRAFAEYPTLFTQDRQPDKGYLAIPEVSSETREYIPIDFLPKNVIASNKLMIMPEGTLVDFAVLTSRMHMAWMRTVAGRLESRYSYSPSVWFTFPLPGSKDLSFLGDLGKAVLKARAEHKGTPLKKLYDPDMMPANLRAAHVTLDRAVDKLYKKDGFRSDRERVEHLFKLNQTASTEAMAKKSRKSGTK